MSIRYKLIMTTLAGLLLQPAPLLAAEAGDPVDYTQEMRERVMKYLQSDLFINEGKGLNRISVGMLESDVVATLGQPHKISRSGLLWRDKEYFYKLDSNTDLLIGVSGGRIRGVGFVGTISSAYATVGGARFGMHAPEVQMLYGPVEADKNSLVYPDRGIRFDFFNGRLRIIRVFQPEG